ncbi:hypothetical protein T439DRAFT_324827 [Meredithblackwellia eburnea MCA 4105]
MTSFIANRVARGTISRHAAAIEPQDPHRETYIDNKGRTRSRRRKMPKGLSKRDERILRSVRRRAHYLDKGFSICGFRFGWTAIFGIIPLAGDITAFLLSYYLVLRKCRQADLPLVLSQRMAFNQAVSVGAGMIPLVGDIILAAWKANSRNAALLEEFLIARAAAAAAQASANPPGSSNNNASSSTSAARVHQIDEAAAQAALNAPGINKMTGERMGNPPPYELAGSDEEVDAGPSASASASASGAAKGKGRAKGKSWTGWYGWGAGSNDETRPLAESGARQD